MSMKYKDVTCVSKFIPNGDGTRKNIISYIGDNKRPIEEKVDIDSIVTMFIAYYDMDGKS